MLNLIKNECIKVFLRRGTYVLLAIVLLFPIAYNVLGKMDSSYQTYDEYGNVISTTSDDERDSNAYTIKDQMEDAKTQYEQAVQEKSANLETLEANYRLLEYQVDHQITAALVKDNLNGTIDTSNQFLSGFYRTPSMMMMISILMIIIAAGTIAREFSDGTIKFLLINPVSRAKIFWSKYLACVLLALAASAIYYIYTLLICLIFNGSSGFLGSYLYYSDGSVHSYSALLYIAIRCGYALVGMVASMTLSFTISSLLRSSSLAIGLSLAIELAGGTISSILMMLGQDWGRYLIFSNTSLDSIASGQPVFPAQTIPFALTVIGVHMVIFLLSAYDGFTRREV